MEEMIESECLLRMSAKMQKAAKSPCIDGTVTLTPTRVIWNSLNPNQASDCVIDIACVTANQRSKAGAPTAMVRFVSASRTLILQMTDETQRDALSDKVAQLLLKFKNKGKGVVGGPSERANRPSSNSAKGVGGGGADGKSSSVTPVEAAARKALLVSNKEMQSMYNELVGQGVVSDVDFWASRQHMLEAATAKRGAGQQLGIANGMMAEVRPTSDGRSNTVKFNLTPEMMHQIFAEKPAVRKAYLANVPEKMSEREFWTRYCRSQYFQRVRKGAAAQGEEEAEDLALFQDDGASESQAAKRLKTIDPSVNLAANRSDCLNEGYGVRRDGAKEPTVPREDEDDKHPDDNPSSTTAIIHDINRHAAVVLDGRPASLAADAQTASVIAAVTSQNTGSVGTKDVEAVEQQWQQTIQDREAGSMVDLIGQKPDVVEPLRIQDPRRYFDAGSTHPEAITQAPMKCVAQGTLFDILRSDIARMSWTDVRCDTVLSPGLAQKVLGDLTHQIDLASGNMEIKFSQADGQQDSLAEKTQIDMLQAAKTSQELLRHFWAQQPVETKVHAAKTDRIRNAMASLYDRLQDIKDALPPSQRNAASRLLRPVLGPMDAAFTYHDQVKQHTEATIETENVGSACQSTRRIP
mmetsp:Transcript_43446/g.82905  ORF Transcript_43446/g.82905 Transcript_43446/m.82905 type:complete len:636 (-) Transcript_43446:158-2065(-)